MYILDSCICASDKIDLSDDNILQKFEINKGDISESQIVKIYTKEIKSE